MPVCTSFVLQPQPPCVCSPPHNLPRPKTSRPSQRQQGRPEETSNGGAGPETGQEKEERHGPYITPPAVGDPPSRGKVPSLGTLFLYFFFSWGSFFFFFKSTSSLMTTLVVHCHPGRSHQCQAAQQPLGVLLSAAALQEGSRRCQPRGAADQEWLT